ncbi:MAG: hypothetical protein KDD23_09020 [Winogradskyella sp.]|nr:hypothetical protein [Winogradskyella sp.]
MQNKTAKIFDNLEGRWNFSRTIRDRISNTEHYAIGEVVFTRNSESHNTLQYVEQGKINLLDVEKEFAFQRKYLFKIKHGEILIIFDDGISKGKLYQKLIPEEESDTHYIGTEHLCLRDHYEGRYAFPNNHEFSILYFIRGPKKNMQIETNFNKIAETY